MKVAIIGATGNAGQAIFKEAKARGHQPAAFVRNESKAKQLFGPDTPVVVKDAFALTAADFAGYDAIIDAFASPKAYQNLDIAMRLVALFREQTSIRLGFILGASSLKKPDGSLLLDDVVKAANGQPWVQGPIQQVHELSFLKWVDNVNWFAMSPQSEFKIGPKTSYKLGTDQLLTAPNGKSEVSTGNFAGALVDELEQPKHIRQRFTVCDAE